MSGLAYLVAVMFFRQIMDGHVSKWAFFGQRSFTVSANCRPQEILEGFKLSLFEGAQYVNNHQIAASRSIGFYSPGARPQSCLQS